MQIAQSSASAGLLMLCLASACQGPRAPATRIEPAEHSTSPKAATGPTAASEVDTLLARARLEAAAGTVDDALITLYQVRNRDSWHPAAHLMYQDLRLATWTPMRLYQEYRPLLGAEPGNPVAAYFTFRPLLLHWSPAPEHGPKLTDAEESSLASLRTKLTTETRGSDPWKAALAGIRELLPLDIPSFEAALAWDIESTGDTVLEAYLEHTESLLETHDGNGDARCLHELVAMRSDPADSILRYGRDLVLGIGSPWMAHGLALAALRWRDATESQREKDCLLELARLCLAAANRAGPGTEAANRSATLLESLEPTPTGN